MSEPTDEGPEREDTEDLELPDLEPNTPESAFAQVHKRVAWTADQLAEGLTYSTVVRMAMEKYSICRSMACKLVQQARTRYIPELYNLDQFRANVANALNRAYSLHEKATLATRSSESQERASAMKTSLATQRWIGELQGITGPIQIARLRDGLRELEQYRGWGQGRLEAEARRLLGYADGKGSGSREQ